MISAYSQAPTSALSFHRVPILSTHPQSRGDVAMITRPTFADANTPWILQRSWTTGHVGVVRAALWDEGVSGEMS